jgi:hypothetical protein
LWEQAIKVAFSSSDWRNLCWDVEESSGCISPIEIKERQDGNDFNVVHRDFNENVIEVQQELREVYIGVKQVEGVNKQEDIRTKVLEPEPEI